MMSAYSLNIDVSGTTLKALRQANMVLYVFKGVNPKPGTKVSPIVWFKDGSLYEKNKLSWKTKHDVYIASKAVVSAGTKVVSSTTRSTAAGGTAFANDDNTIDLDNSKGTPKFYSFLNTGTSPHTCGLSNVNPKGQNVPICATLLHGASAVSMEPIEKVYLCFSNALHEEGTVLIQTSSPGLVVDVTDDSMSGASVSFDIDKGWSCSVPAQESNCVFVDAGKAFGDILNSK